MWAAGFPLRSLEPSSISSSLNERINYQTEILHPRTKVDRTWEMHCAPCRPLGRSPPISAWGRLAIDWTRRSASHECLSLGLRKHKWKGPKGPVYDMRWFYDSCSIDSIYLFMVWRPSIRGLLYRWKEVFKCRNRHLSWAQSWHGDSDFGSSVASSKLSFTRLPSSRESK